MRRNRYALTGLLLTLSLALSGIALAGATGDPGGWPDGHGCIGCVPKFVANSLVLVTSGQ